MKKILFLVLILIVGILWGGAKFHPEVKEYDFGKIFEKDGKVSYDFIFKNTGDSPLKLIDVHAG